MMAYYDTVRRALIMIFALNLSVAFLKGGYGLFTSSLSMSADGLHSLLDSSSNIIGLVGVSLASRPPDREHPYGHAKFENFASVGIAVLLFYICVHLILESLDRFQRPTLPQVTQLSFAIMAVTLIINIAVSSYENTRGRAGEVYVDLHIGVNPSLSIDEAHQVGREVERTIESRIEGVRDVAVHIEPWDEAGRTKDEKDING